MICKCNWADPCTLMVDNYLWQIIFLFFYFFSNNGRGMKIGADGVQQPQRCRKKLFYGASQI